MPHTIPLHAPSDRAARLALTMVLALTALVGILLAGALLLLREQTLTFARQQTQSITLAVSEQTVRTLQTVEQALHAVEPIISHAPRLDMAGLVAPTRTLSYVKAVWWIDRNDQIAWDSDPARLSLHAQAFGPSHPLWNAVRTSPAHTAHWIASARPDDKGTWYLITAHPVYDADHAYRGMLMAAMDPQPISALWHVINLGADSSIALLHRNGDGMLREPPIESSLDKNYGHRPLFKDYLAEQSEGWYIDHSAVDGVERLFQYRVPPSHPQLVVVVTQSTRFMLGHWWRAVVIGAAVWLTLALVVGVLTQQLLRQWALNRTAQTLMREQSRGLRELSQRILQAQEDERARIARELHDELGQSLTALKINLQSAQRYPQQDAQAAQQDNLRIVEDTITQVRTLALALRPSILDNLGLPAALQWMGHQIAQRAGFAFALQTSELQARLCEPLETCCFRIAQESLTNIARHAKAQHAWITLHREHNELVMRVQDDGVGMDLAGTTHPPATLGLAGMRERAALVQGTLTIESQSGQGCTITLRCPLQGA